MSDIEKIIHSKNHGFEEPMVPTLDRYAHFFKQVSKNAFLAGLNSDQNHAKGLPGSSLSAFGSAIEKQFTFLSQNGSQVEPKWSQNVAQIDEHFDFCLQKSMALSTNSTRPLQNGKSNMHTIYSTLEPSGAIRTLYT